MSDESQKVYVLPNLMTGGNLVSGFAATLAILHVTSLQVGNPNRQSEALYLAIGLIFAACMFDFLDGLVARLCDQQSAFGREFDSFADLVSFGVAPGLLVYRVMLQDSRHIGWVVTSIYLLCGAIRLSRFNCAASTRPKSDAALYFDGFPIPAAAGLIASLASLVLWLAPNQRDIGTWKWLLASSTLFLSFMMLSRFRYPSIKVLCTPTQQPTLKFLALVIVLIFTALNRHWMPLVLFLGYLLCGFLLPYLAINQNREILPKKETVSTRRTPTQVKSTERPR
jgi:CDP-diacylglycerol---serine O-phosphatidyltransferase